SPSRFASIWFVKKLTPVRLPRGRLRLATRPDWVGSAPIANTMGMVEVAAFMATAMAAHSIYLKFGHSRIEIRPLRRKPASTANLESKFNGMEAVSRSRQAAAGSDGDC